MANKRDKHSEPERGSCRPHPPCEIDNGRKWRWRHWYQYTLWKALARPRYKTTYSFPKQTNERRRGSQTWKWQSESRGPLPIVFQITIKDRRRGWKSHLKPRDPLPILLRSTINGQRFGSQTWKSQLESRGPLPTPPCLLHVKSTYPPPISVEWGPQHLPAELTSDLSSNVVWLTKIRLGISIVRYLRFVRDMSCFRLTHVPEYSTCGVTVAKSRLHLCTVLAS